MVLAQALTFTTASMTTPASLASTKTPASIDVFANTSKARLQALYSDFSRQRQSNPTAFQANVEWWRKALSALLNNGFQQDSNGIIECRLVLQANRGLLDRLKLEKIGKPLAMGAVVVSRPSPYDSFLSSNKILS